MKISSTKLNQQIPINKSAMPKFAPTFRAAAPPPPPPPPSKIIDWILKNKVAQKAFKFASENSFGYTTLVLAISCMIFRPATIMALPGQKKEDKQYLSVKSVVASMIATAGRLLIIIPFGLALVSKGKKAKAELENPIKEIGKNAKETANEIPFPAKGTEKFDAFNFATNNIFSAFLAIGTAALMPKLITTAMAKILPKDNKKTINSVHNETKNGVVDVK